MKSKTVLNCHHVRGVGGYRSAFTLTEMLVVLGILAVVMAILLPVLFGAREKARGATCLSNMRQLSLGLTLYAQDSDGYFPTHVEASKVATPDWDLQVLPYAHDRGVFHCPSCPVPASWVTGPYSVTEGYALNSDISGAYDGNHPSVTDTSVRFPSSTVTLCEVSYQNGPGPGDMSVTSATDVPEDGSGLPPGASYIGQAGGLRHQGGSNYTFADGHSHWYRPNQISGIIMKDGVILGNTGESPSFAL